MLSSEGQETARGSDARVEQGFVNIGGQVDIGTIHINNVRHDAKQAPAEVKKKLIEVFTYESMTDRRDTIDNNYWRTCSWLTQTLEWLQWRQEPSSLLWIKGNPGAGKSTLMKYAAKNVRKRRQEHVMAHFFDARSVTELDKSTEGLYRSLLVQFLRLISTEAIFESRCFNEALEEGARKKWSPHRLAELLQEAIQLLEPDPITVFIDALDECNEEMLQDTVDGLGDLLQYCDSQLRICFASRYFPHITRLEAIDLRLEDQTGHYQDISLYIEGNLNSSSMHLSDRVRETLQKKARGSFIWAYLVIRILKDDYRRGRVAGLEARLEALPKELEHLYKEILDTKKGNFQKETLICFALVLLARQSLTIGDLWWAIKLSSLPAGEDIGVLGEELKQMSDDDLRRSILDVSCGLVTDIADNDASHNVRFIHETTREFCQIQTGVRFLEKKAEIHETFKRLCWRTLQFCYGKSDIPRRRYPHIKVPFLYYACGHTLDHANLAQECGIDQSAFLQDLVVCQGFELMQRPPRSRINRRGSNMDYQELIDTLIAADCSILIRDCQLLHELALAHDRIGLTKNTLCRPQISDAMNSRLSTPFSLLYLHTKRREHESHICNLLAALQRQAFASLVEFYSDNEWISSFYADVLFDLAEACSPVAAFFIVSVTSSELLETSGTVSIREAALGGFVNVFHFLLQRGLPAGPSTFSADEAMIWACKNGHTSIVKVLLQGYQSVLHAGGLSSPRLRHMVRAAWKGHVDVVKLLLNLHEGLPQSLVTQANDMERLAAMNFFPRSKEVIRLLTEWRLKYGIPGDFRYIMAEDD